MRRRFMNYSTLLDYSNYLTIEAIEDVSVLFDVEVQWTINGIKWESSNRVIVKAGQLVSIKRNATQGESLLTVVWDEGAYNLKGNIMSLLFGDDTKGQTSMLGYTFEGLFSNSNVISVDKDFLPAITLTNECYRGMFSDCKKLITAPELPATTLTNDCYRNMFWGCTSLTTAPELPATTLADYCYYGMFWGCSKLNYIKMLATDVSAGYCLTDWVKGVLSTGTFVKNPSMTSLPTGKDGIPSGWTVVDDGEVDIDTTNSIIYTSSDGNIVTPYNTNVFGANIVSNTYSDGKGVITFDGEVTMIGEWAFNVCSSLTSITIPDSVTTIGDEVFIGCTSLTSVTIGDSITTIGDEAFHSCSSLTSVYCKATTPPALDYTSVFDHNASGRKIYVPTESVEAYKIASGWSKYADAIVGYDFGDESVNLITFTITTNPYSPPKPGTEYETIIYEAEVGMNWIQWCNSKYNINGFITYITGRGEIVVESNYNGVYVTNDTTSRINAEDLIENNGTYYYE